MNDIAHLYQNRTKRTIDQLQAVLNYIEAFGPVTKYQIIDAVGLTNSTVDHRVDELSSCGKAKCKGHGPSAVWIIPGGRSERVWKKFEAERAELFKQKAKEAKRKSEKRRREKMIAEKEACTEFERDPIHVICSEWATVKLPQGAVRSVFELGGV